MNSAVLTLLLAGAVFSQISFKCFYYFNNEFMVYNLKDLNDKVEHNIKVDGGKIVFNLCNSVNLPAVCAFHSAYGYFLSDDEKKCTVALSDSFNESIFAIRDPQKPEGGFDLSTPNSGVVFHIQCDPNAEKPTYSAEGKDITIKSQDSCGKINEAARVIQNNKYILCGLLLVLGAFLLLFGGYKWEAVIGVMGFLCGFLGILFIFWALINFKQTTSSYVIILAIAVLIGIFFAYLSNAFVLLSYITFGFVAGFFMAAVTLDMVQLNAEKWVYFLIKFAAGLILGAICASINKITMIIVTSIVGSFVFFYSLGFMTGLLKNPMDVWERIKSGEKLETVYYVFFGVAILFAILGMCFQYKKLQQERKPYGDVIFGERLQEYA